MRDLAFLNELNRVAIIAEIVIQDLRNHLMCCGPSASQVSTTVQCAGRILRSWGVAASNKVLCTREMESHCLI